MRISPLHICCSVSMYKFCSFFGSQFNCHISQLSSLRPQFRLSVPYSLLPCLLTRNYSIDLFAGLAMCRRTGELPDRAIHVSCPGAPVEENKWSLRSFHNLQPTGDTFFSSSSHRCNFWVAAATGTESVLFAIASSIPTQYWPEFNKCLLKERKEKRKEERLLTFYSLYILQI